MIERSVIIDRKVIALDNSLLKARPVGRKVSALGNSFIQKVNWPDMRYSE